jgi:hypothetical protein
MDRGNRERPPRDDYGRPLPKQRPLPDLPDREWLRGRISKVEYEFVYFNNQIQYLTTQAGEQILDEVTGAPIPRRQFVIDIELHDHRLPNGDPRRVWLRLGASMGGLAHLPQFLVNMGMEIPDPTPDDIIAFLDGVEVKIQMANRTSKTGKAYQQVIWDSAKPA